MQKSEENLYSLLKNLKILSGSSNTIMISSGEIGKKMGISQQSASRLILKAVDEGFIKRDLTARRQHLVITERGIGILMQEFSELSTMLGAQETTKITGYVQSGLGEGRYYISRKPYIVQFQEKLGFIPFLGTLNLRIDNKSEVALRKIRSMNGIKIEGFKTEDRTFGGVKAFHSTIEGIKAALIFPERSVYSNIIEVISSEFLREKLGLQDGSSVEIEVKLL